MTRDIQVEFASDDRVQIQLGGQDTDRTGTVTASSGSLTRPYQIGQDSHSPFFPS